MQFNVTGGHSLVRLMFAYLRNGMQPDFYRTKPLVQIKLARLLAKIGVVFCLLEQLVELLLEHFPVHLLRLERLLENFFPAAGSAFELGDFRCQILDRLGFPEDVVIAGLLHDADYERFPDQHPTAGKPILEAHGYPADIVRAIQCHADFLGLARHTLLEQMLFAVDELTGFIIACTLVKPTKSLSEIEPQSVRKKLKDKAFARAVLREDIYKGAAELGVELDAQIRFVAEALKPVATEIGLNP